MLVDADLAGGQDLDFLQIGPRIGPPPAAGSPTSPPDKRDAQVGYAPIFDSASPLAGFAGTAERNAPRRVRLDCRWRPTPQLSATC